MKYGQLFAAWLVAVILFGSGCGGNQKQKPAKQLIVNVAVAASAEPAIAEIAHAYALETGTQINLIKGASGKLSTQIMNGAPFDLFISADTSWTERLFRDGNASTTLPPIAWGQLAVWTKNTGATDWQAALTDPATKRIAIPNPQTAPFGRAAMQLLENSGLIIENQPKLVYAESVGQVALYIQQESVDAAITSYSTLITLPERKGKWIIVEDWDLFEKLPLVAVIIKQSDPIAETQSQQFYDYLLTKKASKILLRNGFEVRKIPSN
jgi:molybdate transport system substrate-binding protein